MFSWFKSLVPTGSASLEKLTLELGQMLDSGRHVFDSASNALLGGTDPEVIREDLFATDRRINKAEMQIRRELVVHATFHGVANFPACLMLMSIVKDGERIGDYAKNLFDLAVLSESPPKDEFHTDLVALKTRISTLLADTRRVFDSQDVEQARSLSREFVEIEDKCDEQVEKLLRDQTIKCCATRVLTYRYFKRVSSHCMNVATSIFMPLDKIDYFDEKPRPEEI